MQYICQEDLSLEMHLAQHGGYAPHHRTAGPEQADTPSVPDHKTEGTQNIALLPTELAHINYKKEKKEKELIRAMVQ